jgi:hypothetical protein
VLSCFGAGRESIQSVKVNSIHEPCRSAVGTWIARRICNARFRGIGVSREPHWVTVKVRISKTPDLDEVDGVRLDDMKAGSVREVSPSIGAWLVAEGYAEPEMRREFRMHEDDFLLGPSISPDRLKGVPRRRSYER